jgi:hypothetical protein
MRRVLAVVGVIGVLSLASCGGSSSGSGGSNSAPTSTTAPPLVQGNPITGPINRARQVAGQQSQQTNGLNQQTGSDDPTQPYSQP